MSHVDVESGVFRAHEWTIEPQRHLVCSDECETRLEPRVMAVLVYLVQRVGVVVPREELLREVWDGQMVGEEALTVAVSALRRALGDDPRQPRFVETIPRRGYRWAAPVAPVEPGVEQGVDPEVPIEVPADSLTPTARVGWWRGSRWRIAGALLLVAVLAVWTRDLLTLRAELSRQAETTRGAPADPRQPSATDAFLRGRYLVRQRSRPALETAVENLRRALALEPEWPEAHAWLAEALILLGAQQPQVAPCRPLDCTEARQAVEEALRLDPLRAESQLALGTLRFLVDWDLDAAEHAYRDALDLDLGNADAHQRLAWLLSARGRLREADQAARVAVDLDPVTSQRYCDLASTLAHARRPREAIEVALQGWRLTPSLDCANVLFLVRLRLGEMDAAYRALRLVVDISGGGPALPALDGLHNKEGWPAVWRWFLVHAPPQPVTQAYAYLQLGQPDEALTLLERAVDARVPEALWLAVDPRFDTLRSRPRLQQLLRRLPGPHTPLVLP